LPSKQLERVYRRPRYLATCIFAVQFILFAVSTGNSISFSSYILRAATGSAQDGTWLNRGIAVAAITAVCLIHAFAPKTGIAISNVLGGFKLVMLSLVVFTGFAALAGRGVGELPKNFSTFDGPGDAVPKSEETTGVVGGASTAAGYAIALLQVQYSYGGWENANYVRFLVFLFPCSPEEVMSSLADDLTDLPLDTNRS
jgi:amino acid transporter